MVDAGMTSHSEQNWDNLLKFLPLASAMQAAPWGQGQPCSPVELELLLLPNKFLCCILLMNKGQLSGALEKNLNGVMKKGKQQMYTHLQPH